MPIHRLLYFHMLNCKKQVEILETLITFSD
ncbi:hypothetical protein CD113_10450 [Staphylococcus simiae]|nr:hypothetical protein CD113_10450 [Staphylococcus simiae]